MIFDLEDVVVSTSDCRLRAWKQTAHEQGILMDEEMEARLGGLNAAETLEVILKKSRRTYSPAEKLALTARQCDILDEELTRAGGDILLPEIKRVLYALRKANIKTCAVSGEGMARPLLSRLGILAAFDSKVDGGTPETLLEEAVGRLHEKAEDCLALSRDERFLRAAERAGMRCGREGSDAMIYTVQTQNQAKSKMTYIGR